MNLFINISCEKWLEKKPNDNLTVPNNLTDLQGILDNASVMNNASPAFDEASADNYFVPPIQYNTLGVRTQEAYTWQLEYYNWPAEWGDLYLVVNNCNIVLEGIETMERTVSNAQIWDNVKGSALFYRSFSFLKAAFIYAKAFDESTASDDYGIVIRLTSDPNAKSVRSTVKQTYEKIIEDLKAALTLLPVTPIHTMRPSRLAVYGTLARAYLSMRMYDSAYKYADLCLSAKSDLLDYKTTEVNPSSNTPIPRFNKETIFYSEVGTHAWGGLVPTVGKVDTTLVASYDIKDMRKKVFLRDFEGYQRFKGSYSSNTLTFFTGIAVDEVLLMRAECLARVGNTDRAMSDLNQLLEKRWVNGFTPLTAGSAEEALELVLTERRKELIFRGLRWMDIKRLNKEGRNIVIRRKIGSAIVELPPNDNRYALPLPSDIINQTQMPQNPR